MKKFIPLAFALVVFSACSSGGDQASEPVTINADTVLDDQMFSSATTSKNLEKCGQISNADRQDECKMVVESLLTTDEAVAELDSSLCEDIEDERYRENCVSNVEEIIADKEAQEKAAQEAAKKEEERVAIESEAITEGDADICNDIEDENQKYSCRYNVLANQAAQKNDPSLCDEIGDESFVEECKKAASQS